MPVKIGKYAFLPLLIFFSVFCVSGARAENGYSYTPALSGMGPGYTSETGSFEINFSGKLSLEFYSPQKDPPYLIKETEEFISGSASLFTDIFIGNHLYGLVELRADRGEAPSKESVDGRIEQAFLRFSPGRDRDFHVQVGKFVSPFGEYPQRHHTTANPFIRPPLSYDYRTMICPFFAPAVNDGFINWKFRPDIFRPTGAPIIWDAPYQIGGMIFGGLESAKFRLALMNSAPSSEPEEWDHRINEYYRPSFVVHVDYTLIPEFKFGISYNTGPYSQSKITPTLPAGKNINDYIQEIWGFDATFTRGRTEIRTEFFYDRWEVPNVIEDPKDLSYYAEIKHKFLPGLFGAVRYSAVHFNKIIKTDGTREKWDYDIQRWQLGLGYYFNKNNEIRAEYMINRSDGPFDPEDNLFGIQYNWKF